MTATAEYLAPATHNGKPKHAPAAFAARVRPGVTRVDLARLFAAQGYRRGAEIGVADGRYSLTLCQAIPDLQLSCVDVWRTYRGNHRGGPQEQHDRNWRLAQERLAAYDVTFVRAFSMDAVRDYSERSLDFVYIDAHHGFDYVMQDLIEWAKRVRPGGIVAGHDCYHFDRAGVVEAVEVYTRMHEITDWSLCDEREPSFWWVKL